MKKRVVDWVKTHRLTVATGVLAAVLFLILSAIFLPHVFGDRWILAFERWPVAHLRFDSMGESRPPVPGMDRANMGRRSRFPALSGLHA